MRQAPSLCLLHGTLLAPHAACSLPALHTADALVTTTVLVSNIGNTRMTAIALSSDAWTAFDCDSSSTATIATLSPSASVSCTAAYTFNQSSFEGAAVSGSSGSLSSYIRATAGTLPQPGYASASVPIATTYQSSLNVQIGSCSIPTTAREWGC